MKKLIIAGLLLSVGFTAFTQDSTSKAFAKKERKREEIRRRNAASKQDEEGVLSFTKHLAGGVQLRTNGYGAFIEIGRSRTPRFTSLYSLELTEIKHPKEEKSSGGQSGGQIFANSFIYGKINNFYQAKLGFGQQYVFGQKGNKNGVAVLAILQGGLSVGLLKPYYVQARNAAGQDVDIKYDSKDSSLFLSKNSIIGGSGLTKGFSEMKIKPGGFIKASLRFDFGRFNESIQALEIGLSVDGYASKIQQMAYNKPKNLFLQGHVAFVFGKRK